MMENLLLQELKILARKQAYEELELEFKNKRDLKSLESLQLKKQKELSC